MNTEFPDTPVDTSSEQSEQGSLSDSFETVGPRHSNRRLLAGLVVLFLVLVLPLAFWLGQQSQDIRQRASSTYPSCGAGSSTECPQGRTTGSFCTLPNGNPGSCQNTDTNPACTCVLNLPQDQCRQACIAAGNSPSQCASLLDCPACKDLCKIGFPASGTYCDTLPACTCPQTSAIGCQNIAAGSQCTNGRGVCAMNSDGNCICGPTGDCGIVPPLGGSNGVSCDRVAGGDSNECLFGSSGQTGCFNECLNEPGVCVAIGGTPGNILCQCQPGGGGGPAPTPVATPVATPPNPPQPSASPGDICAQGCTWNTDPTCGAPPCNTSACLRRQYCIANDGVTVCEQQCIADNSCSVTCNPPSPTPAASPSPAAACQQVKAYSVNGDPTVAANWTLLSSAQMANLQPGQTVYFAVVGGVSNGATVTGARIRVATNHTAQAAFTQANSDVSANIKPGSSPTEYFKAYVVPAGTTSVQVGAEVYSPQFDVDGGTPWNSNSGWR